MFQLNIFWLFTMTITNFMYVIRCVRRRAAAAGNSSKRWLITPLRHFADSNNFQTCAPPNTYNMCAPLTPAIWANDDWLSRYATAPTHEIFRRVRCRIAPPAITQITTGFAAAPRRQLVIFWSMRSNAEPQTYIIFRCVRHRTATPAIPSKDDWLRRCATPPTYIIFRYVRRRTRTICARRCRQQFEQMMTEYIAA